ncbi:MAG: MotE family protein [Methyloligellaceae bacterium]
MGNLRLLPMVALSAFCLLAFKAASLFVLGGSVFNQPQQPVEQNITQINQIQPVKVAMNGEQVVASLVTGAAGEKQVAQNSSGGGANLQTGPNFKAAKSEFAILQSLANRRRKLDEREKQLILQRNLLKAAEQRLETKIAEMKNMEARMSGDAKKKKSSQSERYRKLVEMYSKMKPADAARIFNRLDVQVLMELVEHMNSRAMASILSSMDPVKAEQLTNEIASQGKSDPMNTKSLPKISNK